LPLYVFCFAATKEYEKDLALIKQNGQKKSRKETYKPPVSHNSEPKPKIYLCRISNFLAYPKPHLNYSAHVWIVQQVFSNGGFR
jgi:hypothetical protein